MKGLSIAASIFSGLALAACQNADDMSADDSPPVAGAVEQAPPVTVSPAAAVEPLTTTQASLLSEANWVVLFAGHDLTSFDPVGDAQWNIIDDYVEADGYTGSFLVSKGWYTDFRLQVEFWPSPEANSGIFIRCDDPVAVSATNCYEINIFDQNENPDNRTGAIVNRHPPMATLETGGKWNSYDIVAEGTHIVVTLNGTVTADFEDDTHPSGPFALQNNGGLIRFRAVQLRPL